MSQPLPLFSPLPSLPKDKSFRFALSCLAVMVGIECGLLLFKPFAPAPGGPHSEPPAAPASRLMVQPRLEVPKVRAPWQQMLEESRSASARGQTAQALRVLADVEMQLPNLPFAIAELAAQFEKLGATDRAIKLWERVYQYGASAGIYFSAAEAKLRLLEEQTAHENAPLPRGISRMPPPVASALPSAPVRFGKIQLRENPESTPSKRHFVLMIPVQKNTLNPINAKEIDIEVQFYDQVQGKTVERTNALIHWKWATNAMNWNDANSPNLLEVEYRQGPPRKAGERRTYFGYVASVYYQDKLQDYRSDPPRLGQQYPPPRILPKEASP